MRPTPTAYGAFALVGGNLEVSGRTVWATRTGLAFGGGLGVVAPTGDFGGDPRRGSIAQDAAMLRPWSHASFEPAVFGLRPFVDVRSLDGPLVIQFRQGLDWLWSVRDGEQRRLAALFGLYLGYRFGNWLSAGLESFELYLMDRSVADSDRVSLVLSPSARLALPYVEPTVSAFMSLGSTMEGRADRVWGIRVAVTLVYDTSQRRIEVAPTGR